MHFESSKCVCVCVCNLLYIQEWGHSRHAGYLFIILACQFCPSDLHNMSAPVLRWISLLQTLDSEDFARLYCASNRNVNIESSMTKSSSASSRPGAEEIKGMRNHPETTAQVSLNRMSLLNYKAGVNLLKFRPLDCVLNRFSLQ